MLLTCCVYHIWMYRNNKIFSQLGDGHQEDAEGPLLQCPGSPKAHSPFNNYEHDGYYFVEFLETYIQRLANRH